MRDELFPDDMRERDFATASLYGWERYIYLRYKSFFVNSSSGLYHRNSPADAV
jgi:hypothetical protein